VRLFHEISGVKESFEAKNGDCKNCCSIHPRTYNLAQNSSKEAPGLYLKVLQKEQLAEQ
jgi:hypothetical protein